MKKQSSDFLKKAAIFLKDLLVLLIPLSKKNKILLMRLNPYLDKKEINKVKRKIKQKKAEVKIVRKGFSFLICSRDIIPKIISEREDLQELNKKINEKFWEEAINNFSKRAWQAIPEYIAPNTLGLKYIKQAITLVLASNKNPSILLIGNPSFSKKEFISNSASLLKNGFEYPSSIKEMESQKNAFLSIEGINNLSKNKIEQLNYIINKNNFRTLGSASFKKEFYENIPKNISKELAFPLDIIYNFDMIFLLKNIDLKKFKEIAESISTAKKVEINQKDVAFIKKYLTHLPKNEIEISNELLKKIKEFSIYLKKNEKKLLKPVNEKTIENLIEMTKSSARLDLREKSQEKDLDRVFEIYKKIVLS